MSVNGQLDKSELDLALGFYFIKDAAWALIKISEAHEKKFGYSLSAAQGYRELGSPSDDPFKSPATQWSVWNKYQRYGRPKAAYPGNSNHGWAKAVDLSGSVAVYGSAEHEWFRSFGLKYGWRIDTVAGEPWHADFQGLSDEKKQEMEDDMPLSEADLEKIRQIVREDNSITRKQIKRVRTGITNVVKAIGKNSRKRDEALADQLDAIAVELDKED